MARLEVNLLDLIGSISTALDYVSSTVSGHHGRVGVSSFIVGQHLGFGPEDLSDVLYAGLLHDIGAFSLQLPLDGLQFDAGLLEHASHGYRLLRGHSFLKRASVLILHHHTSWSEVRKSGVDENTCLLASVLSLMDRVDVLRRIGGWTHSRQEVRETVAGYPDGMFAPQVVEAFMDVSGQSDFWQRLDDLDTPVCRGLSCEVADIKVPEDQLVDFSGFFSHVIDFRSRHTATHSQGVAETAVQLAALAGMDKHDQKRMRLAGNLHDLGKLAVSSRLLDKPGALTDEEFGQMQNHASVTEQVLRRVPGLETVTDWASQHHERLNGRGYPHRLTGADLSLGSRIVAVADIHTAITEDRPYREGMKRDKAVSVLKSLADEGALDAGIVDLAIDNHDRIDAVRQIVQSRALAEFKRFAGSHR